MSSLIHVIGAAGWTRSLAPIAPILRAEPTPPQPDFPQTMPQMPTPGEAAQNAPVPSFNFLMILLTFTLSGLAIQFGIVGEQGLAFVFVLAGWVLSLCLHEFAHAYVAWKGGDDGVVGTGYLTLDPRYYVHPVFSIVMPIVFTLMDGIGFPGGAVFINDERLRGRVWRSAVSLAGPVMNVLVVIALLVLYALSSDTTETLHAVLAVSALYQATAIVLNLLPIPGLDGYGIVQPWLPDAIRKPGDELARHSGLIVTGLFLFSGAFSRAVFGAGLNVVAVLGFSPEDAIAGYRLMRLW